MKSLLILAGIAEIATGLALLAAPALVGHLLLNVELAGIAVPVAGVLGIALIALGLGCASGTLWLGMWTYTALAALYLAYLGIATPFAGPLLWPAVAAHALLAILLPIAYRARPSSTPAHPKPDAAP